MQRLLAGKHLPLLLIALACVGGGQLVRATATPTLAPMAASAIAFDHALQALEQEQFLLEPNVADQRLAALEALRPPGDRARDLQYQAQRCFIAFRTDPRDGAAYAQRGQDHARRAGELLTLVRFHYCEAMHRDIANNPHDSLTSFNAGIALAQRLDAPALLAEGLSQRGSIYSYLGDPAQGLQDLLAAKALLEAAGDQEDEEDVLLAIAIAWRRIGELDQSLAYLEQARVAAKHHNNTFVRFSIELQIGYCHFDAGRQTLAHAAFQQALALTQQDPDRSNSGAAHIGLADMLTREGNPQQALIELSLAERDLATVGDGSFADSLVLGRGQAYAAMGRHDMALEAFQRAEVMLRDSGNPRYQARLSQARSASLEALGNTTGALADLRRYAQLRETLDAKTYSQQTQLLRHQFDAERRDIDHRRLQTDQHLRGQQLDTLRAIRYWQHNTITLGALLVVLLLTLILRQIRHTRRLHALVLIDPLTAVANRRSILVFGEQALAMAQLGQSPLAAFALDIDHFKRINDTHGHGVGDVVLTRVAHACQATLRQFDRLGRIGGEEFLVLLPNSDLEIAAQIAERLRHNVEIIDLSDLHPGLKVTVSVGLAELRSDDALLEQLVERADVALYRAKSAGRNRVETVQAA